MTSYNFSFVTGFSKKWRCYLFNSRTIFLFLFALVNNVEVYSQDSVKKKDIQDLFDLVYNKISFPDSVKHKPRGETIFFELLMKDNRAHNIEIWSRGEHFLYDLGMEIVPEIKNKWKPNYKFPEVIIYPLRINFFTDSEKEKESNHFFSDYIDKLDRKESGEILILPMYTLYFNPAIFKPGLRQGMQNPKRN